MTRTLSLSVTAVAIAALSLAACKKSDLMTAPPPQAKAPAASGDANASMASADQSIAPSVTPQTTPALSPPAPMLAMAYKLGLAVPADQVRPLMESHQEACERAGTDQCQVMGANASADGDEKA